MTLEKENFTRHCVKIIKGETTRQQISSSRKAIMDLSSRKPCADATTRLSSSEAITMHSSSQEKVEIQFVISYSVFQCEGCVRNAMANKIRCSNANNNNSRWEQTYRTNQRETERNGESHHRFSMPRSSTNARALVSRLLAVDRKMISFFSSSLLLKRKKGCVLDA